MYAWTFTCRPEAVHTIAGGVYSSFTVSSIINIACLYLFGNELINLSFVFLLAFDLVIYITISMMAFYFYSRMSVASKIDGLLTRALVLNGLSLYATWTTIAALINSSIVLQYSFDVNPSTFGTVTLSLF